MDISSLVEYAAAASDIATAIAISGAGIWALYRFILRREYREVVKMELAWHTIPYDAVNQLVSFDVSLTNTGPVIIQARIERNPAYRDKFESVKYAADLLIRKIPSGIMSGTALEWHRDVENDSPKHDDIEVDLLHEYYQYDNNTYFWLEPAEEAVISANVVLSPGLYLVMITFLGQKVDENFWRRLYPINVPPITSITPDSLRCECNKNITQPSPQHSSPEAGSESGKV